MLTVMGEIFVLKPGAAGAIGRARWRNSSESIAMMKMFLRGRVAWCFAKVEDSGMRSGEWRDAEAGGEMVDVSNPAVVCKDLDLDLGPAPGVACKIPPGFALTFDPSCQIVGSWLVCVR